MYIDMTELGTMVRVWLWVCDDGDHRMILVPFQIHTISTLERGVIMVRNTTQVGTHGMLSTQVLNDECEKRPKAWQNDPAFALHPTPLDPKSA